MALLSRAGLIRRLREELAIYTSVERASEDWLVCPSEGCEDPAIVHACDARRSVRTAVVRGDRARAYEPVVVRCGACHAELVPVRGNELDAQDMRERAGREG